MQFARGSGTWWPEPIPTAQWERFAPIMSAILSSEEWGAVDLAYTRIEQGERTRRFSGADEPLPPEVLGDLDRSIQLLQNAVFAIAPHTYRRESRRARLVRNKVRSLGS
jgi:hypothetical protein